MSSQIPGRVTKRAIRSALRAYPAVLSPVPDTSTSAIRSTSSSCPPLSLSQSTRTLSTLQSASAHAQQLKKTYLSRSRNHCLQAAAMSTMPATHGHNEACCNIPPVITSGYVPKGSYEELGGLKTYVTGASDATKGIVAVFDIFGYVDQTVQGADILGASSGSKYKVFMPDWFKGNPCPTEWYPPDTEQKQKDLGAWFGNNAPHGVADALPGYVEALKAANPSIESWALIGYCWGGKVTELVTSRDSNPFSIAAGIHPAMVDTAGADKIRVPYMLLASQEEPADTIKEFESKLNVPHHVETFGDQVHGWMAARADLANPRSKEEYIRGYKTVLRFFNQHW
ncbi:dienelactone hydrolase [Trichophyton tonsurans CBS 112818]|uniref:Dienelactone hydrolase n=1 Tax=Trichophyton tonsurans (strain CBS 112818) TaxID=647933 RepID=F2RR97_TRIT1|nr:dienelactone hydrolase [Trichophyton tonsurans CBS 112818]